MSDSEEAQHKTPDGPVKDWKAVDFKEEDLVDDDWIAKNTKAVE